MRPINGSQDSLQHSRCHFVWRRSYDAMKLSYRPFFTRRPCYIQGEKNSLGRLFKRNVRPRRQVSKYFWIRNFFFPNTKISTPTHIRKQIEYARPHVSRYFWIRNFFFARTVLNTHGKELGLILWRLKKYPDLASTRFRIHSGFKNFHSGGRIQKVADSYAGLTGSVWTVAVSRRKKLADSKISGYVWTGPNLSRVLRNHWTSTSLS